MCLIGLCSRICNLCYTESNFSLTWLQFATLYNNNDIFPENVLHSDNMTKQKQGRCIIVL